MRVLTIALMAFSFLTAAFGSGSNSFLDEESSWAGYGGGPANRHFAMGNNKINSANIHTLQQHCRVTYQGGLTSSPTVCSISLEHLLQSNVNRYCRHFEPRIWPTFQLQTACLWR